MSVTLHDCFGNVLTGPFHNIFGGNVDRDDMYDCFGNKLFNEPPTTDWLAWLYDKKCLFYAPLTYGFLEDLMTYVGGAEQITDSGSAMPAQNLCWDTAKSAYELRNSNGGQNCMVFPIDNLSNRITANNSNNLTIYCRLKVVSGFVQPVGIGYAKGSDSQSQNLGLPLFSLSGLTLGTDWVNIAVTINATSGLKKYYLNGTLARTESVSTGELPSQWKSAYFNAITIGGTYGISAGQSVSNDAFVKDVYIFNRVLTSAEIALLDSHTHTDDLNITLHSVTNAFDVSTDNILAKYYSVENRAVIINCNFTSNTIARIFCTTTGSYSGWTTCIHIDTANKQIWLNNRTTDKQDCQLLNLTDTFVITMRKFYLHTIVTIARSDGKAWVWTYSNDGSGGSGSGAVQTAITTGELYDYYGFGIDSGDAWRINSYAIKTKKVSVMAYGDSITHPESYFPANQFNNAWTKRLYDMRKGDFAASGRGGTQIGQINLRRANELPFIMPTYCIITIGTNGGNTSSNLTELVNYIKGLGITPILNNIPCYSHNGDTTSFVDINNTIASVRSATNVNGARLNIATSINNDGVSVNINDFWKEEVSGGALYYHHPNSTGAAKIITQMQTDIPQIFT